MKDPHSFRGRFVEQKLMLSSSPRCDQIYKNDRYDLGHTVVLLKTDLDVQQTHLRLLQGKVLHSERQLVLPTNIRTLD